MNNIKKLIVRYPDIVASGAREIKYLVVHCSDTTPDASIDGMLAFWERVRKWHYPGYHFIIKANGDVIQLLDIAQESNGVLGFNKYCLNICYVGGKTKDGKHADTRTPQQKDTLFDLLLYFSKKYPKAICKGHGEFRNQEGRTCPNFNVRDWLHSYVPRELRWDGYNNIKDLNK